MVGRSQDERGSGSLLARQIPAGLDERFMAKQRMGSKAEKPSCTCAPTPTCQLIRGSCPRGRSRHYSNLYSVIIGCMRKGIGTRAAVRQTQVHIRALALLGCVT